MNPINIPLPVVLGCLKEFSIRWYFLKVALHLNEDELHLSSLTFEVLIAKLEISWEITQDGILGNTRWLRFVSCFSLFNRQFAEKLTWWSGLGETHVVWLRRTKLKTKIMEETERRWENVSRINLKPLKNKLVYFKVERCVHFSHKHWS